MKKFLTLLVVFLMTLAIHAEDNYVITTEKVGCGKVLDNWFIGINAMGTWSLINHYGTDVFWKNINPAASVKIGKYFNPNIGFQLAFEGGFNENTKTFLDHSNLTLESLVNFSNLIGGYKGKPRLFEVVGELGLGWFHTYALPTDNASVKAGVELNFNLGKYKAWQLNIIPSFTYVASLPILYSYASLAVGTTYKFKCSNGTHNFSYVNAISNEEIARLNSQINNLYLTNDSLSEALATALKTIEEIDTICIVENEKKSLDHVVGFEVNSAKIQGTQMVSIYKIAKAMEQDDSLNITIHAYADAGTGNAEYNQILSEERATAVVTVLVNKFNINPDRISAIGHGSSEQLFNENDWNRIVIFTKND